MKISFQKIKGNTSLGIAFFWMMKIDVDSPIHILDNLIPELFYDYFFIGKGQVQNVDTVQGNGCPLPQQTLKTIHTYRLTFMLQAPLILFGARLSLRFAELFWQKSIPSNTFLVENWVENPINDLTTFASQITETIQKNQAEKTGVPMLSAAQEESDWLAHFSPRHKRRLYKSVFGISKKEMRAIQSIHSFLGQACDFGSQSPRIIEHINSDLFYDQPHLNRAFKKMTGLTPLEHFQSCSILQDNLMAVSYNENSDQPGIMNT